MFGWLIKRNTVRTSEHKNSTYAVLLSSNEMQFVHLAKEALGNLSSASCAMLLVAYWNQQMLLKVLPKKTESWTHDTRDLMEKLIATEAPEANEIVKRRLGWFIHAAVLQHLESLSHQGTRHLSELLAIWGTILRNSPDSAYHLCENVIWSVEEKRPFIDWPEIPVKFRRGAILSFAASLPPEFVKNNPIYQETVKVFKIA